MIFEVFPAGTFQANCYIIGDERAKEGIVIDPGAKGKEIFDECCRLGIKVRYIILTHGHGDHIGGVFELVSLTKAEILMNQKDEFLTKGATKKLIPILGNIKLFEIDKYINDGDMISVGDISIEVLETPGHTPGGISLKINDILITGDTLFQGSVGRTDFPMGSHEILIKSIKDKLLTFTDETKVYPGHGPETTIGDEKKYNPFL